MCMDVSGNLDGHVMCLGMRVGISRHVCKHVYDHVDRTCVCGQVYGHGYTRLDIYVYGHVYRHVHGHVYRV